MSLYSHIRSQIRMAVCLAAWLAAQVSFAADAPRQQAQAQLLDQAEFLCDNCFFGPNNYHYCFAADNQILIGYQTTRVLNYTDKSKNYLTKVRPRWAAWTAPGQTVPISYDAKHIWVSRADITPKRNFWGQVKAFGIWATRGDNKQVRLTRSSMRDIFTNDRCRGADGAKAN